MTSTPVARGMILCETVRPEPGRANVTLVNCFNQLTTDAFPCSSRAFSVVAFLSDGFGNQTIHILITHLEGERTIYTRQHGLDFPDRLLEIRYRFQVTGCVFPSPGTYEVELFAEGELITSTVFRLKRIGEPHD